MNESPAVSAIPAPPVPGLFARLGGVVVSPRTTFERLLPQPKVLGAMAFVTFVSFALAAGFMSTERGRNAFFARMYQSLQERQLPAQQMEQQQRGLEQFQQMATQRPGLFVFFLSVSNLIIIPLFQVAIAGVVFLIFNVVMGGTATYKQVLAVVAHAGIITTLQQLVTTPLNFARGTMVSATNFSVLLPMVDPSTLLGHFLVFMDLFAFWGLAVLAIGLSVLYRRKTGGIATALFVIYGLIALGFALLSSR